MSYLSRLVTRNVHYYGFINPSKNLYTNFTHPLAFIAIKPTKLLIPNTLRPIQLISPMTTVRIKATKQEEFIEPAINEHDKYNACLGRPLSPHIRIYRKQLTSLLSFGHRLTGLMMLFYVYVVTLGTWIWPDINTFFDYLETLDKHIGEYWWTAAHRTVKFLIAYPFCYHAMNAIRLLSWDVGKLLGIGQIYKSGYLMQALAIATALFLVFMVPFGSGEQEDAEKDVAAVAQEGDGADANKDADKDADGKGAAQDQGKNEKAEEKVSSSKRKC